MNKKLIMIPFYFASCLLFLLNGASAFRLLGPVGPAKANPFQGRQVPPTWEPPFVHWDLREFEGCMIPYSVNINGTADIPEGANDEFGAIADAFQEWEDVEPAAIEFSHPENTDKKPFRRDYWNVLSWEGDEGDDELVNEDWDPGDNVGMYTVIILPGPDEWVETIPNNAADEAPRGHRDDVYDEKNNNINAGEDGIVETRPNNPSHFSRYTLGLTGVFYNNKSGKILEVDILFNDYHDWKINEMDYSDPLPWTRPQRLDVQSIATHEIGHFIGLNHTELPVAAPDQTPTMWDNGWDQDPFKTSLEMQSLHDDDKDGCNFLYTPDLGDAPDPYPSKVHTFNIYSVLNGVERYKPANGAEHLFGYFGSDGTPVDRDNDNKPDWQYEWLGEKIDDHKEECNPRLENKDRFDDGVSLGLRKNGSILLQVNKAEIGTVKIVTTGRRPPKTPARDPNRYIPGNPQKSLWLSAWFDWNKNGMWEKGKDECIFWWGGGPNPLYAHASWSNKETGEIKKVTSRGDTIWVEFWVKAPELTAYTDLYARFRLDYGEDQGWKANIDGTLEDVYGAAQFGEVEDYLIEVYISVPPYKIEIEQDATNPVNPGEVVDVPIFITNPGAVGGFQLYVEFDPTVLTLLDVERGGAMDSIDFWFSHNVPHYRFERFYHRQLPCVQQCETYKINIVGIADIPDGNQGYPLKPRDDSDTLAILRFQVAKDSNLKGFKIPVKWEWDDLTCTENTLSDPTGYQLFVSDNLDQFDTLECSLTGPNYNIRPHIRFIDGGVHISGEGLEWIGDININNYPYEIADAVLFANYFIYGEDVFQDDPYWRDIQINATDVNQDGIELSVSDFVFLIRIILEDISPKHKLAPSEELVNVALNTKGGVVKVVSNSNSTIGAGLYVFRHSGELKNLIMHTDMDVKYHDADGELRVLVYSFEGKSIPAGTVQLFSFEAKDVELVQVEAADFYGSALKTSISAKILPTRFALMNNYPNPFNLSTSIGFALPVDCQMTLKLYNIAGQLVRVFEGEYDTGVHTITWDGTNIKGEKVASGIYFYRLVSGDFTQTKKMLLMK